MNILSRAILAALVSGAAGRSLAQTTPTVPVTGPMLPGMERFDTAVLGLMARLNSPGAQLAITRNGRLVLARGYGYADREAQIPVQPDALFRVASLTKFLTAVAALTLVEEGKLDLEMKAFPFLGLTPLPANAANADPRVQNITVRQLLHHTGGWDRDISGDLTNNTTTIASAAGVTPPADVDTVIRYYLGVRLDFEPGTRYAYSNFGYIVLGRIIERIAGQPLATYFQTAVLGKAGVTRAVPGRSLLENRQPNEVRYYDYPGAPLVRSTFPPTTALVPAPYGGVVLENRHASGAYLFTAIDYVRLLGAVDGSRAGANILTAASINLLTERPAAPIVVSGVNHYGMGISLNTANGQGRQANWFHDGSLPGTMTYMVRFASGWSYAIFFNTRPNSQSDLDSGDISAAMNPVFNMTSAPTGDLFLTAKPEIVAGPTAVSVAPGGSATFVATVSSVTPATHQWWKNGSPIAGATGVRLDLANVSALDAGAYHLESTNAAGMTSSATATLTVGAVANPGRLVNLSVLSALAGSEDSFSLGYVAGGSGTQGVKPLLIRAAGPSLGALGVDGTLADPRFELYVGTTRTGQNDNWGGAETLAAAMAGVGAFAYVSPASRDAAALTSVNANENNSVKVLGTGAGAVIAELYDATPENQFTATTPRLLNVSVLKHVGSGLTVGFSVGGGTAMRVLVRAVGPTLGAAPFGVGGVVADPQLVLYRGTVPMGENNDWGGSDSLAAAFTQVGAFALPAGSRDAALLVTLTPGSYSAVVSGVNNTSGVAIVEVYEVP